MKKINRKFLLILLIPILFFIIAFITLKDYGISWDEPIHFIRGQAYLKYFIGEENLNKFINNGNKSYYSIKDMSSDYFLERDSGHPPTNDILASLSNLIFFQKLGILGDIESYHLFNIFASTILVFVVVAFAYQTYGTLAALISGIVISTYPLFFAESHFNIKDPPQAAFYALCIWAFYNSLKKFSWKWLLLSSISCGFCLGMKFNILFLPLILVPYLMVRYDGKFKYLLKNLNKKYIFTLILSPLVVAFLFYAFWPYLWQSPLDNFLKIFGYYKDIGTGYDSQPGYFLLGFNLYPSLWIAITTPFTSLFLFLIGLWGIINQKRSDKLNLLIFLWLAVPIVRVTLPGTSIYGGIRQILEFLPAFALICGLGAKLILGYLQKNIKYRFAVILIVLLSLYPVVWNIKNHPNQNVYFNFLVGGLKGAKEKNIPSWGNSFGNAYKQAINWINDNVEENARLALVQGTGSNISLIDLRNDIDFTNENWSGIKRKGEYLLELTHDQSVRIYPYAWDYINKFLKPVYEVKVDGVAIATVWKNDIEHTFEEMRLIPKETYSYNKSLKNNILILDFGRNVNLNRFSLIFDRNKDCNLPNGTVETSLNGVDFVLEEKPISEGQIPGEGIWQDKKTNKIVYYFPAREARYLKIVPDLQSYCVFNEYKIGVEILE